MMIRFIFFFLLTSFPAFLWAQGPPIISNTAGTLGLGGSAVRTFGTYTSKEKSRSYAQTVAMPYNLAPTFQVGGAIPLKWVDPDNIDGVFGLGDLNLFAKYQFLKFDRKAEATRITAIVRQTFPTASAELLGPDLFQTYFGVVVGNITLNWGVNASIGYELDHKNIVGRIPYSLAFGLPLLKHQIPLKQVNLYLEAKGKYGIENKNHALFVAPGIQYILNSWILLETNFQYPVLQINVPNPTNFAVLLGARFLL